jgi:hypothetical protein
VGESYGGVRIALMLDQIFGFGRFGERSAALERDLAAHFGAVFDDGSPSRERIATQFAYQVYIQGVLGPIDSEPCAILEHGLQDCSAPSEIASQQLDQVFDTFVDPTRWQAFYGHDLASVAWLWPEHRQGVHFRTGPVDEAALNALFGPLADGGHYYAWTGGDRTWLGNDLVHEITRAFLDHAGLVRSLITNAADDQQVITAHFPAWVRGAGVPGLVDVVHDQRPRAGVERPGWMRVRFEGGRTLEVRAPPYESGHMVPLRAGQAFADDVQALLSAP